MNEIESTVSQLDSLAQSGYEMVLSYAPKLALAIITLMIGLWVIGLLSKLVTASMEKSKVDKTLIPFVNSLISWVLKLLLFISVASMVGIATTSFVAVLGAAGLAIGLALQGSLANFAGGVLIMIFKPYRVGDLVEAQGQLGEVREVQIFNTILVSFQNKKIIVPNGLMSNGTITNYSEEGKIRVDLTVGISYDADVKKAKSVLLDVMHNHKLVLNDPAPFVGVNGFGDSSVDLVVHPHCKPEDYWNVYFDINEQIKEALDNNGISIPFPQRDVHLFKA